MTPRRGNSLSSSNTSSESEVYSSSESHSEGGKVGVIDQGSSETQIECSPSVRCQLEYVFLDEFTSKYSTFLEGWKEESWTADLYLRRMKRLLNEWPKDYLDYLASKDLERWSWRDYFVLSYLWGDPTARWTIILNGVKVSVTEHQEAALQDMSTQGSTFKIWIDTPYINPNDLNERAHEVKRMEEIYRGASKVIV